MESSPYRTPQSEVTDPTSTYCELKLLSPNGRIGRLRYITYSIAITLALYGVGFLGMMLMGMLGFFEGSSGGSDMQALIGMIAFMGLFILMIPAIILSFFFIIRRLHDMNLPGLLCLLLFVPIIGTIFPLILLVAKGTEGPNKFGPPPPPNSASVKVVPLLFLGVFILFIIGVIMVGISTRM